jgi:hypothetical protein
MKITSTTNILKGAIIGGIINASMNGVKYWFAVRDETSVKLTDDLISSTENTVFAGAVPLATSLAFFLTSIAFLMSKIPGKPPYFPRVFLMAIKNAVFAFGIITIAAILLQRFAGSISVSPIIATIITAIISGLVAMTVNFLTQKDILIKGQP